MSTERSKVHGFDIEALLTIYQALSNSRIAYDERKWETIRTASVLALGILAAVGAIVGGILSLSQTTFVNGVVINPGLLGALAVPLLLLIIVLEHSRKRLSSWVRKNLRRESQNQFFDEFPMHQIEKLLGLHEEIVNKKVRWFDDAPHMFGYKHLHYYWHTDRKLIKHPETESPDPVKLWVDSRTEPDKAEAPPKYRFPGTFPETVDILTDTISSTFLLLEILLFLIGASFLFFYFTNR